MQSIFDYQLVLLDFDGLLVNTEEIHFHAYRNMCAKRGFCLDWSFERYCSAAHYDPGALQRDIYAKFPDLQRQEPHWEVLYREKKQAFIDLVQNGAVHLMPGAKSLLEALEKANIKRSVVTHSALELVQLVRKQNSILDTIPNWITREHYTHPKPNPECYLRAIEVLAKPEECVIGLEDTPRGIKALMETRAQPLMVCCTEYPEIPSFVQKGAWHCTSLEQIKYSL